jgi:hypothetical protein
MVEGLLDKIQHAISNAYWLGLTNGVCYTVVAFLVLWALHEAFRRPR